MSDGQVKNYMLVYFSLTRISYLVTGQVKILRYLPKGQVKFFRFFYPWCIMASLKYKPTCKKYESIKCLYKVIINFTFWGSNDKHIFF